MKKPGWQVRYDNGASVAHFFTKKEARLFYWERKGWGVFEPERPPLLNVVLTGNDYADLMELVRGIPFNCQADTMRATAKRLLEKLPAPERAA
jgi:hypothetical protein